MPRKGQKLKARRPAAIKPAGPQKRAVDPLGHLPLLAYMEAHFEWMGVTGYSADTVNTTEIYTHVSIEHLRAIHDATHPARLVRQDTSAIVPVPDAGQTLLDALDDEAA